MLTVTDFLLKERQIKVKKGSIYICRMTIQLHFSHSRIENGILVSITDFNLFSDIE